MRTFKVDTNAFFTALQQQTGIQTNIAVAFHQFLSNSGVNLLPPKTIFFNHGLGVLFVRATESDLDAVEKAVVVLNNYTPPQIHIKARFIEVPEDLAKYQLGDEFDSGRCHKSDRDFDRTQSPAFASQLGAKQRDRNPGRTGSNHPQRPANPDAGDSNHNRHNQLHLPGNFNQFSHHSTNHTSGMRSGFGCDCFRYARWLHH